MEEIYQLQNMRTPIENQHNNYAEEDYGDYIPFASDLNENEVVVHGTSNGMTSLPMVNGRDEPEVSASAIAALMQGKVQEAKVQQHSNGVSMSNIPASALEALMGGKLTEATKITSQNTRRRMSEDEIFDTERLLKERAEKASQNPVSENKVIQNSNNILSDDRLEQLIEAKVIKVLQRISGLNESEKKQDEIMMVIGDHIFSGKLVKIGKMKK